MNFYHLVLGVLGVWRITHLLNAEDGPWDAVVRLRRAVGMGFWASVLDCFQCLSLWIAAPFAIALGQSALESALLWPALSGAAILLERGTGPASPATPTYWTEEYTDDVLRTGQASHEGDRQGER